jgi:uncharacterized RDD family membrane protein YckC
VQKIRSASWMNRFWAWIIDVLIVSIPWHMSAGLLNIFPASAKGLVYLCALAFVYWSVLEGYRGQSLGKMVLNLVVVGPVGEKVVFRNAMIESFGKAFFLPADCLIGWLFLRGRGQRFFNWVSDTIVTSAEEEGVWCSTCSRP